MKLRGIEFGSVLDAAGVRGFGGEGYWQHWYFKRLFGGFDFNGSAFVSKTTTLHPRDGNMVLTDHHTPKHRFPDCVSIAPWRGMMLNAVGLSGPGLQTLLDAGIWQNRTEPFLLSIMSVAESSNERLDELRAMIDLIGQCKPNFRAPFGLQINLSCPNTGHDPRELIGESEQVLDIAQALNVPVMPKFAANAPVEAVLELDQHAACDAICVSNTIKFGDPMIDWEQVWGTDTSPLAKYGGGGISGAILRPIVCNWITRLREAGFQKPINGGGGILAADDVTHYHRAGASSVFIGSVSTLRPWRLRSIINEAQRLNWEK